MKLPMGTYKGCRARGTIEAMRQDEGDYLLKPYVSSDPELTVTGRTEKDEFLILTSDGLWDVISSEMACWVIRKCLEVLASDGYPCGVANSAAKEAAAVLVRLAISRGSVDNISVVVVKL
ncbi:unnamed protein product [Musa acuminata var. zebrina]